MIIIPPKLIVNGITSKKMITEPSYVELLKSCTNWNHQISKARSKRGPFLDCQTAIAQKPSHLYRSSWDRIEEEEGSDRVYSWPAWRWKKRKKELNSGDSNELINSDELLNADPHKMPGLENPGMRQDDAMISSATAEATKAPFQESVYIEYDELSDDFDEIEEQSDGDDYEEYSSKRRRGGGIKRGSGTGRKRRAAPLPSYTTSSVPISQPTSIIQPPPMPPPPPPSINDKPYCCLQCGAKYKSKPGLNYHLAHVHNEFSEYQRTPTAAAVPAAVDISHFCDFCLGDATENKKTGQPEELVSCHDCGRSGHPTCLNFTSNMIISTKKYGWQCIECKSCAICGTSENDDQLLFCDDCDRGFHLYCLNPPLSAPPEGEWSCHLCQVEFGPNASQPATGGQYGTAPINK